MHQRFCYLRQPHDSVRRVREEGRRCVKGWVRVWGVLEKIRVYERELNFYWIRVRGRMKQGVCQHPTRWKAGPRC